MSLRNFLKVNRQELDLIIRQQCPNIGTINDADRRQWIENDEGLYHWARREGVKV